MASESESLTPSKFFKTIRNVARHEPGLYGGSEKQLELIVSLCDEALKKPARKKSRKRS